MFLSNKPNGHHMDCQNLLRAHMIGGGEIMYIQINTWAFPYWPGYHPETPILARDGVEGQYGSRDDNQANMEMPMY